MKRKINRFSSNVYKVNDTEVAVPYITVKGNVSILFGHASSVFLKYCKLIRSEKRMKANIKKGKDFVSCTFHEPCKHLNQSYLAYYEAEEKAYRTIPFTQDPEDKQTFHFKALKNEGEEKKALIYIYSKK